MKLAIENQSDRSIDEADDLTESLALVDGDFATFAILETADGNYIQTSNDGTGYIVEKQLGSLDNHYEAVNLSSSTIERTPKPFWKRLFSTNPQEKFDLNTVVACFDAFRGKRNEPSHIKWRKLNL